MLGAPVLAVRFASPTLLLSGAGRSLTIRHVDDTGAPQMIALPMLDRVHGISSPSTSGQTSGGQGWGTVAVWGGRSIVLVADVYVHASVMDALPFDDWVLDVRWVQGGRCVAVALANGQLIVLDVATKAVQLRAQCEARCILYAAQLSGGEESIDSLVVVAGTVFNEVLLWEAATGRVLHRFLGHKGVVFAVRFETGVEKPTRICSVSDDRTIRVWGLPSSTSHSVDPTTSSAVCELWGHGARVWDCVLRGDRVYSVSEDSHAAEWSCAAKERVATRSLKSNVYSTDVDPSGRWVVAGCTDGSVRMWPASSAAGSALESAPTELKLPGDDAIRFVVLSKLTESLLVTSVNGQLCENKNGSWKAVSTAGEQKVQFLAMSKNERWLATWNVEGAVFVRRRLDNGEWSQPFTLHQEKRSRPQVFWTSDDVLALHFDNGEQILLFKLTFQMEAVHAERKQEIRIVPPKEYVAQVESKSAKKRKARESDDEEDNGQPDEKSGPAAGGPPLIMGVLTLSTPTGVDVAVIGTQWGSVLLYRLSDGQLLHELAKMHMRNSPICALNSLQLLDDDSDDDEHEGQVWPRFGTGGRDGYYCTYQVVVARDGQNVQMERLTRGRAYHDVSVVSKTAPALGGHVVSMGFFKRDFYICDEHTKAVLFRSMCYGGHRSWDVRWSVANPHEITFAYVRSGSVFVHSSNTPRSERILQDSFHSKSVTAIACLGTIDSGNGHVFLTGGEDRLLFLSCFQGGRWQILRHLEFHCGAIKALCVVDLDAANQIVFSGGAQSEVFVWRVVKDPQAKRYDPTVQTRFLVPAAQDTRVMSIAPVVSSRCSEDRVNRVVIAVACSDGLVVLCAYDMQLKSASLLAVLPAHEACCVLVVKCIAVADRLLLMAGGTDGTIALYDVTEATAQQQQPPRRLPPIASKRLHQCGVNCMALQQLDASPNVVLVATGGDDNAIAVNAVRVSSLLVEFMGEAVVANAHAAAVKGIVWVSSSGIVSTATDQRVQKWTYAQQTLAIDPTFGFVTSVTDVSALCRVGDDRVVVAGAGVELFS